MVPGGPSLGGALGAEAAVLLAALEMLRGPGSAAVQTAGAAPTVPVSARLLTPEEAAGRLSVTVRWLYRHAGQLPFTRKLSRKVLRFEAAGLERWLKEQRP
jgi:hypothetical protein